MSSDHPVRFWQNLITIVDGAGNPWWIAREVCDYLGYVNSRDAVATLFILNKRWGSETRRHRQAAKYDHHQRVRPVPDHLALPPAGSPGIREMDHGKGHPLDPQDRVLHHAGCGKTDVSSGDHIQRDDFRRPWD
jgi:hypothetical protein